MDGRISGRGCAMTLHFVIPLAPVTKKNSQQIVKIGKRRAIMPSKAYTDYAKAAALFVPQSYSYITAPVTVTAVFYMPTRRRVDLTNLLEAIDDVIVAAGLLADDHCKIIVSHDGSRVAYDKQNPRTEVTIRRYHGALPW